MAENTGTDHSLKTEIALAFQSEGIQDVVDDIKFIGDDISDLSSLMTDFERSMSKIKMEGPFQSILKQVDEIKSGDFKVDGTKLRDHLANKVAQAITKAQIDFTGEGLTDKDRLKVPLNEKFWEKNRNNISEALGRSMELMELDAKDFQPLDSVELIQAFQKSFNRQILQIMEETDIFSKFADKKNQQLPTNLQFKVTPDTMTNLMKSLEIRLGEYLADPKNINLEGVDLNLKLPGMEKIIKKIEDSIGKVDSLGGLDTEALANLPNINSKLNKFKEKMETLLEDLGMLAEQLDAITPQSVDSRLADSISKDLEKFRGELKVSIIGEIERAIEIVKQDMGQSDNKELESIVVNLDKAMVGSINDKFSRISAEVKSLIAKDTESMNIELPHYKDLAKELISTIVDSIAGLGGVEADVDTAKIEQVIESTFDKISIGMVSSVLEMSSIITTSIDNYKEVAQSGLSQQMVEIVDTMLTDMGDTLAGSPIVEKGIAQATKRLESGLSKVLNNAVSEMEIKFDGERLSEITLPKGTMRQIESTINKAITTGITSINNQISTMDTGSRADYQSIVERLRKQQDMIVNNVIRQANTSLSEIRKGLGTDQGGTSQATSNLISVLTNRTTSIARKSMETVTAVMDITEKSMEVVSGVMEDVGNYMEQIDFSRGDGVSLKYKSDTGTPEIDVSQLVRRMIQGVVEQSSQEIEEWYSNARNRVSVGADVSNILNHTLTPKIVALIQTQIEGMFNVLDLKIGSEVSSKVSAELNQTLEQNVSKSVSELSTFFEQLQTASITKLASSISNVIVDGVLKATYGESGNGLTKAIDSELGGIMYNPAIVNLTDELANSIRDYTTSVIRQEIDKVNMIANNLTDSTFSEDMGAEISLNIQETLTNSVKYAVQTITEGIASNTDNLAGTIGDMDSVLTPITKAVTRYTKEIIKSNADNIIAEVSKGQEILGKFDPSSAIASNVANIAKVYSKQIKEATFVSENDITVATSKLHTKIKKELANSFNMNVGEFTKAFPRIGGADVTKYVIGDTINLVDEQFNDQVAKHLSGVTNSYIESIKTLDAQFDTSFLYQFTNMVEGIQTEFRKAVVRNIKDMVSVMTDELKTMRLDARGLSDKKLITQALSGNAMKLAETISGQKINTDNFTATLDGEDIVLSPKKVSMSGVEVLSEKMNSEVNKIEAKVSDLKTNATRAVITGDIVELHGVDLPDYIRDGQPDLSNIRSMEMFSPDPSINRNLSNALGKLTKEDFSPTNTIGTKYNPLHIADLDIDSGAAPYESAIKGISSNMMKYFAVGYLMRVPMKMIGEATKLSKEMDYHLGKARENLLIKDPGMRNTARNAVFEKYTIDGREAEIGSKEYKLDIEVKSSELEKLIRNDMPQEILNISKAFRQDPKDVARFYSIASRKEDDPTKALAKAREVAKISAFEEELDTDFAAKGMEALINQWGIQIGELGDYSNYMLKAAALSNTSTTDLLTAVRDTGSLFRGRLKYLEKPEAFATSMAMSSLFTEATGMSGRQAGTFWKNVMSRPYRGDTKEFLTEWSKIKGFENVSPFVKDKDGNVKQRDYVELFSNIVDAGMKIDDESLSRMMSELAPLRTIGGAEAMMSTIDSMRTDMESTFRSLQAEGVFDANLKLEDISTREVIQGLVDNIMSTTNDEILGYIAGMQQTFQYRQQGLSTQWQSTSFAIFKELQTTIGTEMVYLENVLKFFERNAHHMADLLEFAGKVLVGYGAKSGWEYMTHRDSYAPTDLQQYMAETYNTLRAQEVGKDSRLYAIQSALGDTPEQLTQLEQASSDVDLKIGELNKSLKELGSIDNPTVEQIALIQKQQEEVKQLESVYSSMAKTQMGLRGQYDVLMDEYNQAQSELTSGIQLGNFLKRSMGATSYGELEQSLRNKIKEEDLYPNLMKDVVFGRMKHTESDYSGIIDSKNEIEQSLLEMQKDLYKNFSATSKIIADKMLSNVTKDKVDWGSLSDKDRETEFYKVSSRLDDSSMNAMREAIARAPIPEEQSQAMINILTGMEESQSRLLAINTRLRELNMERVQTAKLVDEATRPVVTGVSNVGGEQVYSYRPKTPSEITSYYRDRVVPAMGLDTDEFEQAMDSLATMIQKGEIGNAQYEETLRQIATQLGVSAEGFDVFKTSVAEASVNIREGNQAILEYMASLKNLKGVDVGSGLASKSPWFSRQKELYEREQFERMSVGRQGIRGLAQETIEKKDLTPMLRATGATMLGLLSSVKTSVSAVAKSSVQLVSKLALMYAAVDLIGTLVGGLSRRTMSEADRKTVEADDYQKVADSSAKWTISPENDSLITKLFKGAGMVVGGALSLVKTGINRISSGSGMTVKENLQMRKRAFELMGQGKTRDEIKYLIEEEFGVPTRQVEAAVLKMKEELNKSKFRDPLTGNLYKPDDDRFVNNLLNYTDDMLAELKKLREDLDKRLQAISSDTRIREIDLLIQGISEQDPAVVSLKKQGARDKKAELRDTLNTYNQYLEMSDSYKDTQVYIELKNAIQDIQKQIKELDFEEYQLNLVPIDRILTDMQEQVSTLDLEKSIAESDFQIKFGTNATDTAAFRRISKDYNARQIGILDNISSQLQGILPNYQGEDRKRILHNLLQIEAEKKQLMVDINDKLSKNLGTFNLPSGIEPMTYYEAATKDNTHRVVSVGAGDTTVQVVVENMTGSQADLDNMAKKIANQVKQAQRDTARQFAMDVKSRKAGNYHALGQL